MLFLGRTKPPCVNSGSPRFSAGLIMMTSLPEAVLNPARLAALERLGLMDSPAEAAFDRLGRLAARILHTPIAMVSLVGDARQFLKSCIGLPEPWATWR